MLRSRKGCGRERHLVSDPFDSDFMDGVLDAPGSRDRIRLPSEQVAYEMGRRVGGKDRRGVRVLTQSQIAEGHAFIRISLMLGLVGAVGGLGYGIWQWLAASATAGAILKWVGIGAAGGALLPSALIAGVCLAFLAAIFWGLGMLLNLLTNL